jgi:hypothetical protein
VTGAVAFLTSRSRSMRVRISVRRFVAHWLSAEDAGVRGVAMMGQADAEGGP